MLSSYFNRHHDRRLVTSSYYIYFNSVTKLIVHTTIVLSAVAVDKTSAESGYLG
jgi:hypothetical protein